MPLHAVTSFPLSHEICALQNYLPRYLQKVSLRAVFLMAEGDCFMLFSAVVPFLVDASAKGQSAFQSGDKLRLCQSSSDHWHLI
ncbi:MAG: hypothetical protein ABW007_16805 [Chitinophagaceae bacterium]